MKTGNNKRRTFKQYDSFHNVDLEVDSAEECDFIEWCCEAAQLKVIKDFEYQPKPISLSEPINFIDAKGKRRSLLRDHVYTPDFRIQIDPRASQKLCIQFKVPYEAMNLESFDVYLDVKGTFQRNDGGRAFSINQKWVYQKTGIYINKIVPVKFFAECGCPKACFLSKKTKKPRKMYLGFQTISQIFSIIA